MSSAIANALIVNAPLSLEQLNCAYRHYDMLATQMRFSGPYFGEAREKAIALGNTALSRYRTAKRQIEDAQREIEEDDGLRQIV